MNSTYTTIQGDKWDTVSFKVYGSCRFASQLIEANLAHKDSFILAAGVVLKTPDFDMDIAQPELPPWKQVRG
ncbi:MAG: tail protein X [Oscillospiraceae bacterium]